MSKSIPSLYRLYTTASSSTPQPLPWFMHRHSPPHLPTSNVSHPPPPPNLPHPLYVLHSHLSASPHLEPATLLICPPIPTAAGPPLPSAQPKGRRKRGRTDLGIGLEDASGTASGIWSWIVLAQVKEGTENRGAIESVVRIVRKALLTTDPPLALPPNSKRREHGGWAMIDAGDFAVHVLSKDAREKFFGGSRREWYM